MTISFFHCRRKLSSSSLLYGPACAYDKNINNHQQKLTQKSKGYDIFQQTIVVVYSKNLDFPALGNINNRRKFCYNTKNYQRFPCKSKQTEQQGIRLLNFIQVKRRFCVRSEYKLYFFFFNLQTIYYLHDFTLLKTSL